ncbi:MAG TPA: hypothetical protein VI759_03580 [Dehalococcoidia bacterium]|nr:hypothetical protein [Dehalococcoidia bacterium]
MNGLKYGLSDSKLVAGVVASFIAMQIATITGFWYPIIHLPQVDWNRFNGTYLVGFSNPTAVGFEVPPASDFEVFITGWIFHVFTGMALGLAFVFLIRRYIPTPYTMLGNLQAAIIFSVVLALISMFILVPYLDPYGAHPGIMSLDLKLADNEGNLRPGWQTPLVILVWHLIYGAQLGSFYQPKSED